MVFCFSLTFLRGVFVKKERKCIIVTGGAGFIGSNFIFYMLNKYSEYKIVCIDKLTYAANIATLYPIMSNSRFHFIKADICDRKSMDKIFNDEKPNIVVNFAAESSVERSVENTELFVQTNVNGTVILMDLCLKYNVEKFHQVSTDEVYGDLQLKQNDAFTEESILSPNNPYSISKATADMLVLNYHKIHSLPITISRCSNNYGPFQNTEKLIPLMVTKILKNEKLPVHGDGTNIRDWIHVQDHCSAIDMIVHDGKIGEIYNVCSNNKLKNIEVISTIVDNMKYNKENIVFVKDRKTNDKKYSMNCNKIKNEIGWSPMIKFQDGLLSTIKWYENNMFWWHG